MGLTWTPGGPVTSERTVRRSIPTAAPTQNWLSEGMTVSARKGIDATAVVEWIHQPLEFGAGPFRSASQAREARDRPRSPHEALPTHVELSPAALEPRLGAPPGVREDRRPISRVASHSPASFRGSVQVLVVRNPHKARRRSRGGARGPLG